MKIKMILSLKKGRAFVTIPEDKSLKEAAEVMCANGIGALLAVSAETPDKYEGIITERDILKCSCTNLDFRSTKVEDIMTRDILVASPEDDVDYVMRIMKNRHIRHLPVIENGKIVGILSIRDILNNMLEEQAIKVRHLSDYNFGGGDNEVF